MGAVQFEVEVPPPFRLDLTAWALRRRPHNAVDAWDGAQWSRSVGSDDGAATLTVAQAGTTSIPRLVVTVDRDGAAPSRGAVADARRMVTHVLGLELDLGPFYALADRDPCLAPLARRFYGMRPPRFPSVFEALVNAVACQQLSLDVGIHLINRLARRYGSLPTGADELPSFPTPDRLARADVETLRAIGFSTAKARTLVALGQRVTTGGIDLGALDDMDDGAARTTLVALPGIGRWSAEYALLRGLGRLQVLPGDDVGAQNNLRRRFGLDTRDYDAVAALSRRWSPYGGLVYFHLLLDRLAEQRYLHCLS